MAIDKKYIDLQVKEILAQKGITVNELAERMGKHQQYVSNIINVSPATSLGSLIAVAKALDVPFRDLFGPGKGSTEDGASSSAIATTHCPHCGAELTIELKPAR